MKYRSTHSSCQLFLAQEQKRLHRLVNVTNSRKHSFINDKYWKGSALFPSHGLTNPLKQSVIISMLHLQNRVHECLLYLMRPNNAVFITFIPSKMNFRISELGKFGR